MIKPAEIFQDYMVLQRQKPICIWGECSGEERIEALWNGEMAAACEVPSDGGVRTFRLTLPAMEAACGGALTLRGSSGDETKFSYVDVGEVWIAGGQSNMEFLLDYDVHGDEMAAVADDVHFRFYDVGEYAFFGEREEGLKDGSHWDRWMTYNPSDAPYFSAVGVYFALRLRRELGVPVGVVGCNWGGTTASAWMDEAALREDDELRVYTDEYDKAAGKLNLAQYEKKNYQMRRNSSTPQAMEQQRRIMKVESVKKPSVAMLAMSRTFAGMNPMGPHSENRPGGLYEVMLKSIAGFGARGVIWYQGESDDIHAECYARLFSGMIACWRTLWQEELPFLFVQLAPFEAWMACEGRRYPEVRSQQEQVAREVPNTYMASIMDVGSRYDIHPKDKGPVGQRLAQIALANIYGTDCAWQAPRMESVGFGKGLLTVEFSHAADGLSERRGEGYTPLAELFDVTCGGKRIAVNPRIDGNCVYLESQGITPDGVITVAFAYMPYCKMSLYSSDDLPALPFGPVRAE